MTTMTSLDLAGSVRTGRPADPSRGALRPLGLDEVRITGGSGPAAGASTATRRSRTSRLAGARGLARQLRRRRGRAAARRPPRPGVLRLRGLQATSRPWPGRSGAPQDAELDARFRAIVARVAAAQEPDGYLNTRFGRPGQAPR